MSVNVTFNGRLVWPAGFPQLGTISHVVVSTISDVTLWVIRPATTLKAGLPFFSRG
jgi:hypothetical protein